MEIKLNLISQMIKQKQEKPRWPLTPAPQILKADTQDTKLPSILEQNIPRCRIQTKSQLGLIAFAHGILQGTSSYSRREKCGIGYECYRFYILRIDTQRRFEPWMQHAFRNKSLYTTFLEF